MLRTRLLAAAGILIPVFLILWLDCQFNYGYPGLWLVPLAFLASQGACAEVLAFVKAKQLPVCPTSSHLACLSVVACSVAPMFWQNYPADCPLGKRGWSLLGAALAFCVIVLFEMRTFKENGTSISRIANSTFAVFYSGVLFSFLIQLRMIEPGMRGYVAFVGTVVTVKFSDVGAYFVGRSFGRNKLAPVLSPGKTIEGAVGGTAAAMLAAAFTFYVLGPWLLGDASPKVSFVVCFFYALSIAIAGLIGDLFESLMKRDADVKDSSRWLPGLGGVLDVLDSPLAAAPVSFTWWISGLFG